MPVRLRQRSKMGYADVSQKESWFTELMSDRRSFLDVCCSLCQDRLSTPKGEHAIPQWLSRWMDEAYPGPFTKSIDSTPVMNRAGETWSQDHSIRYQMPCCSECNEILNRRFEAHAPIARCFFEGLAVAGDDKVALGLWALKTVLLFRHVDTHSHLDVGPVWKHNFGREVDLYSWMINGKRPPDWLSLFTLRPQDPETTKLNRNHDGSRVYHWTDAVTARRHVPDLTSVGFAGTDFQLLFHPGAVLEHRCARAHQLWPPNPQAMINAGWSSDEENLAWRDAWNLSHRLIPGPEPVDYLMVPYRPGVGLPSGSIGITGMTGHPA